MSKPLQVELAAFFKMEPRLLKDHPGKWVIVHDSELFRVCDTFETAAESAVEKFGNGPYLIRQIGAPQLTMPASVMYQTEHGNH